MTSILQWAKSAFLRWFAPDVALTPEHGWLLPARAAVPARRAAADIDRGYAGRGI